MGFTSVLFLIVSLVSAVFIAFIAVSIKRRKIKRAVFLLIGLVVFMILIFIGLVLFITSM